MRKRKQIPNKYMSFSGTYIGERLHSQMNRYLVFVDYGELRPLNRHYISASQLLGPITFRVLFQEDVIEKT